MDQSRSYYFRFTPMIKVTKKMATNTKNNILAISAAPAAIPPIPKIAATIAIPKKIAAHFNTIVLPPPAHI